MHPTDGSTSKPGGSSGGAGTSSGAAGGGDGSDGEADGRTWISLFGDACAYVWPTELHLQVGGCVSARARL